MDEVFGYENFVNEIVWKRSSAHSDAGPRIATFRDECTTSILFYSMARRELLAELVHAVRHGLRGQRLPSDSILTVADIESAT